MKNIKFKIILLLMCILYAQNAFALKQAIFPNKQSLQPIPTYAHPNISGNINSTTTSLDQNTEENQAQVQEETKAAETPVKKERSYNIIIIFVLLSLGGLIAIKQIKKNKIT